MCWYSPIPMWLYSWEVKFVTNGERIKIHRGVLFSGVDSSHEREVVVTEAVNKTIEWCKLNGSSVKNIVSVDYKVVGTR